MKQVIYPVPAHSPAPRRTVSLILFGASPNVTEGGPVSLSGTIDIVSTIDAALPVTKPLAGQLDVVSTITGALSLDTQVVIPVVLKAAPQPVLELRTLRSLLLGGLTVPTGAQALAGVIDGVTTLDAQLSVARLLSGSFDVVSTISGILHVDKPLAGSLDLISTINGTMTTEGQQALAGTIDLVSTLDGTLPVAKSLAAPLDVVLTINGALDVQGVAQPLPPAMLKAVQAVEPTPRTKRSTLIAGLVPTGGGQVSLAGSIDLVSQINGNLTVPVEGEGELPRQILAGRQQPALKKIPVRDSTLLGVLPIGSGAQALAGQIDAVFAIAANLANRKALSGSIDAIATINGALSLQGQVALAGSIDAISTIAGTLSVARSLAGSLDLVSTINGTLSLQGQVVLAGSIDLASAINGALSRTTMLAGQLDPVLTLAGDFALPRYLVGNLAIVSSLDAALPVAKGCHGLVVCVSTIAGAQQLAMQLAGSVDPISVLAGQLSIQGLVGEPFKVFAANPDGTLSEVTAFLANDVVGPFQANS